MNPPTPGVMHLQLSAQLRPWRLVEVRAFREAVDTHELNSLLSFFAAYPLCASNLNVTFPYPYIAASFYTTPAIGLISCVSPLGYVCNMGDVKMVKEMLRRGASKSYPLPNVDAVFITDEANGEDSHSEYAFRYIAPLEIVFMDGNATLMKLLWEENVLPAYYFTALADDTTIPRIYAGMTLRNYDDAQLYTIYATLLMYERPRMEQIQLEHRQSGRADNWFAFIVDVADVYHRSLRDNSRMEVMLGLFLYSGILHVPRDGLSIWNMLVHRDIFNNMSEYFYLYHLYVHPDMKITAEMELDLLRRIGNPLFYVRNTFQMVYGVPYTPENHLACWKNDRANNVVPYSILAAVSVRTFPRLGATSSITQEKVPIDIFRRLDAYLKDPAISDMLRALYAFRKAIWLGTMPTSLYLAILFPEVHVEDEESDDEE